MLRLRFELAWESGLQRRRFATTATMIITRMLARLMDITDQITSQEACLSGLVPGSTADIMAAATTDVAITAGDTAAVIMVEVNEAMTAAIMDAVGTQDTKVMAAGAITVIKAVEITLMAATTVVATVGITAAVEVVSMVETTFTAGAVNHTAVNTVAVDTGKAK